MNSRSRFAERVQQQKRILIIDDEPDAAMTFRMTLEQSGFSTDSYTDPVLAYKKFRDGVYDLVLLDIKMPAIDGFHLYQKMKRVDSRVKICFLTAGEFYDEEIRKRQGFDGFKQESFLRKPLEIKELVNTMKKLLESG